MQSLSSNPSGLLIYNAHLFGPREDWLPGWLLVEGKSIGLMGSGDPPVRGHDRAGRAIDARRSKLLPGFIDLHVHGAVGHEVMDGSPEGLRAMAGFFARHGVTAFLATTWTAAREDILAALQAVSLTVGRVQGGATILGAYLEGPYLNPAKCGAQDPRLIRRADPLEALEFLDTGQVRLLALAPEYQENLWLIEECVRRGVTVSAAHTTAGYHEMQVAVGHGLRHVTHCFNAMTGLDHRELGTVGSALAIPELMCELIADNIHVHPAAQKILIDVKGPGGVILITDAMQGAGLSEGEYRIADRSVIIRDGAVRLPDGTLAGSILTMNLALRNALQATGRPLNEVWPMTSLNPASAIGISASKGSLEVGKDADLVLLDPDWNAILTVVEGDIVYLQEGWE